MFLPPLLLESRSQGLSPNVASFVFQGCPLWMRYTEVKFFTKITEGNCDFSPMLFKYIFIIAKVTLVICGTSFFFCSARIR